MVEVAPGPPGSAWDGHVLLLHRTEAERLDGLTDWVRRGLDRGEQVVYGEAPVAGEDSLVAALEARGVDAASAARDRRLSIVPLEEYLRTDGQHALAHRGLTEGFPAVRMSADTRAALDVLPPAVVRDVEDRTDELTRTRPVSVTCQYPRDWARGARLDAAVAAHPSSVRGSGLRIGRVGDRVAVRGEVDPTNTDVFTAALTAACAGAASHRVCLDLAGVGYIDGSSCWRLDDATRRFRTAGGEVELVAAQPTVARTLWLLEVDQLPGMRLVGGRT